MAKYDWKELEKEYILSDYKSVSAFLKEKNIKATGNTNKQTKGWKEKKAKKEQKKGKKTIEKVIEKESEKEAQKIVDIKSIANDLALNIIKANTQIETYLVKNKQKTKKVTYDNKTQKPSTETITEKESIDTVQGIVDKQGLKMLASALKDINEIIGEESIRKQLESEHKINVEKAKLNIELTKLEYEIAKDTSEYDNDNNKDTLIEALNLKAKEVWADDENDNK